MWDLAKSDCHLVKHCFEMEGFCLKVQFFSLTETNDSNDSKSNVLRLFNPTDLEYVHTEVRARMGCDCY